MGYEYDYCCEDFYLRQERVKNVFEIKSSGGVSIAKKTFCNTLCSDFGVIKKCPVILVNKNIQKSSITFYLSCMINRQTRYKLTCNISEIKLGSDVKFKIMKTSKKKCEHNGRMEGRYLSRDQRDEVQELAKTKTAKQVPQTFIHMSLSPFKMFTF